LVVFEAFKGLARHKCLALWRNSHRPWIARVFFVFVVHPHLAEYSSVDNATDSANHVHVLNEQHCRHDTMWKLI
jgi:hypothetical protein